MTFLFLFRWICSFDKKSEGGEEKRRKENDVDRSYLKISFFTHFDRSTGFEISPSAFSFVLRICIEIFTSQLTSRRGLGRLTDI